MLVRSVSRRQGGLVPAPLLSESHDFGPVAELQSAGEWDALAEMMAASAKRLERAGAEGLLIASNTMHKVYDRVAGEVQIPMLHIGDITAEKLVRDGVKRAGLRSEEHTSELQSLMRISYAVFCLKTKNKYKT